MTLAFTKQALVLIPTLLCLPIREVLIAENAQEAWSKYPEFLASNCSFVSQSSHQLSAKSRFDILDGAQKWKEMLGVLSLNAFGLKDDHPALGPAGALLYYTSQTFCQCVTHFHQLRLHKTEGTLSIDPSTLQGLEVFTTASGSKTDTLFHVLNNLITATGSRLLERLLNPYFRYR